MLTNPSTEISTYDNLIAQFRGYPGKEGKSNIPMIKL